MMELAKVNYRNALSIAICMANPIVDHLWPDVLLDSIRREVRRVLRKCLNIPHWNGVSMRPFPFRALPAGLHRGSSLCRAVVHTMLYEQLAVDIHSPWMTGSDRD